MPKLIIVEHLTKRACGLQSDLYLVSGVQMPKDISIESVTKRACGLQKRFLLSYATSIGYSLFSLFISF
jgi:hypothetical protein